MTWPADGIKVGPGRCMGCGVRVWWNGKYWREDGSNGRGRHVCLARARELWDNTGAGDGCVSVPYALTPVPRPSPDEPGSFASIEVMAR